MLAADPPTRKRARELSDEAPAFEAADDDDARAFPGGGDAAALDAVMALLQADFQCAICQGLVVAPHNLSCSHRFCGACILKWTTRQRTCPTCRATMQGPPALERGVVRRASAFPPQFALTRA
jgi:hypothetical protein